MINLHCANFYGFEKFYKFVLNEPEYTKRPNTKIYAVYGCFPGMIWNGGRPQCTTKITYDEIEKEFKYYYNLGINIELTLNNMLLREEHLNDEYCNKIIELALKHDTICIVQCKTLKNYLRNTYPNLKLKRSCVCCNDGHMWDDKNEYNFYVIDQFQSGNWNLLNSIPKERRKQAELVANVECKDGCPNFYIHHTKMGAIQLGEDAPNFICPLGDYYPIKHSRDQKHFIHPDNCQKYIDNGYEHFKLVSRCNLGQSIHETCFYYFKEEYVPDMICKAYETFGIPMKIEV